jgi:hypothetical protein
VVAVELGVLSGAKSLLVNLANLAVARMTEAEGVGSAAGGCQFGKFGEKLGAGVYTEVGVRSR